MIAAINQGPRVRGFIIHNYNTMLSLASIVNIDKGYLTCRPTPTAEGKLEGSNGPPVVLAETIS